MMLVSQVPLIVAAIVTYIKSRAEMAKNSEAIAENTRITKHGSTVAGENAKEAKSAAQEAVAVAKEVTHAVDGMNQEVSKKLNGGIDDAIQKGIAPVKDILAAHTAQDAKDLAEVKKSFEALEKYVHESNHEMDTTLQIIVNGNALILRRLANMNGLEGPDVGAKI